MSKFCQTFQSPYSLHKPPYCFHIAFFSLTEVCGQIFGNIFFFLDLLVQKIYFDKNHWFRLLSTKNEWIISLFLISVLLHNLSVSHSTFLLLAKKTRFDFQSKTLLLLFTKSPNMRKFCSSVCSLTFFRFLRFCFLDYWDDYCKCAGFDSFKPPAKCTN